MTVCTHRWRNTPCGKKGEVIRYAIKGDDHISEYHRCKFHAQLNPIGFETVDEAWAAKIADVLSQDLEEEDDD